MEENYNYEGYIEVDDIYTTLDNNEIFETLKQISSKRFLFQYEFFDILKRHIYTPFLIGYKVIFKFKGQKPIYRRFRIIDMKPLSGDINNEEGRNFYYELILLNPIEFDLPFGDAGKDFKDSPIREYLSTEFIDSFDKDLSPHLMNIPLEHKTCGEMNFAKLPSCTELGYIDPGVDYSDISEYPGEGKIYESLNPGVFKKRVWTRTPYGNRNVNDCWLTPIIRMS